MKNRVITGLFCLFLAAGIVSSVLVPDRYYSESEKRTLTQFPELTLVDIRSGKFGDALEKYLADQFPGRDSWVAVKTAAERLSGKTEIGGVYFGRDGYLIDTSASYSVRQASANIDALKRMQDALTIPFRVMLVPTASEILSDKLPPFAPTMDQSAILAYAQKQGLHIVDVTAALRSHCGEYIFYKTDHHWTSLGAYYAYAAWMQEKGQAVPPLSDWTKETLCDSFRGTTYAKVNAPFAALDTIDAYYKKTAHRVDYNSGNYITDSIYERKYLEGSDQYATFLNSNQAVTAVSGDGSGKLLIIKDSYANCFAQFAVDDHAETHLIDLRFFRGDVLKYIEEIGITEVLVLYNIPNFLIDKSISSL